METPWWSSWGAPDTQATKAQATYGERNEKSLESLFVLVETHHKSVHVVAALFRRDWLFDRMAHLYTLTGVAGPRPRSRAGELCWRRSRFLTGGAACHRPVWKAVCTRSNCSPVLCTRIGRPVTQIKSVQSRESSMQTMVTANLPLCVQLFIKEVQQVIEPAALHRFVSKVKSLEGLETCLSGWHFTQPPSRGESSSMKAAEEQRGVS